MYLNALNSAPCVTQQAMTWIGLRGLSTWYNSVGHKTLGFITSQNGVLK